MKVGIPGRGVAVLNIAAGRVYEIWQPGLGQNVVPLSGGGVSGNNPGPIVSRWAVGEAPVKNVKDIAIPVGIADVEHRKSLHIEGAAEFLQVVRFSHQAPLFGHSV